MDSGSGLESRAAGKPLATGYNVPLADTGIDDFVLSPLRLVEEGSWAGDSMFHFNTTYCLEAG